MGITPDFATMIEELNRATSALSRASGAAVDPYRFLIGGLLDMASNLEDFIAEHGALIDGYPTKEET